MYSEDGLWKPPKGADARKGGGGRCEEGWRRSKRVEGGEEGVARISTFQSEDSARSECVVVVVR